MTTEQFIAAKSVLAVKALYGADVAESAMQVQVTRKDFEGDYTLVVFPLLRVSRQAPVATALCLSNVYWREALQEAVSQEDLGRLPSTGRRVMVEFSSPNTNKPLHLGHIRNNLLGASVSELLKAAGNEVIKSTLVNDRGVHICKSMYAWEKLFNGATAMWLMPNSRKNIPRCSMMCTRCWYSGKKAIRTCASSGR